MSGAPWMEVWHVNRGFLEIQDVAEGPSEQTAGTLVLYLGVPGVFT